MESATGPPECTCLERRVPRVGPGTDADIRRGSDSAGKKGILGVRRRESWAGGNVQTSFIKR